MHIWVPTNQAIADRCGASISYKPIPLGGVLQSVGSPDGAHECDASQQSKTQPFGHAAMGRPLGRSPSSFQTGILAEVFIEGEPFWPLVTWHGRDAHALQSWVDEEDVAQPGGGSPSSGSPIWNSRMESPSDLSKQ